MSRLSAPRRSALARLAKHGSREERSTCAPQLGRDMAAAGLVERWRGTKADAVTMLAITDAGRAALNPALDVCDCATCRPKDPRIKP